MSAPCEEAAAVERTKEIRSAQLAPVSRFPIHKIFIPCPSTTAAYFFACADGGRMLFRRKYIAAAA
jgi:hypothetical protein